MNDNNDEFVPPTVTAPESLDLSSLDNLWDTTKPADGFSQVPAGKYQAYVDKAYIARGKQPPHNPMIKMELVIAGPTHAGQRLFRNNVLATQENIAWAKKDLAMAGIGVPSPFSQNVLGALSQLIGVGLNVTVTVKPPALGQDRPSTNVYIDGTFGRKDAEESVNADGGSPT